MLIEKQKGFLETAKSLLNFIADLHQSSNSFLIFLFHPWMIERLKAWETFEEVALLAKSMGSVITLEEAYDKFYIGSARSRERKGLRYER
jgi:hypothetical protein